MKTFTLKMLGLVTSALLLGACSQMATYENEDLTNSLEKADQARFKLNPYSTGNFGQNLLAYVDCAITCITEGGPYYETSENVEYANGEFVDVITFNTPTQIIYKFLSSTDIITIDGVTMGNTDGDNDSKTATLSYALANGWKGCDLVSRTFVVRRTSGVGVGGGVSVSAPIDYNLVPVCPPASCDGESFSYNATNENLNVIFSYDAAAALTGAVVEFTFPQIMNMTLGDNGKYTAPDGKMYSVNNATNQTVFTWVGDIGCTDATATTFEFNFSPDCSAEPANDGQARIWADTKVNGLSVKNTGTPNINYEGCPVN